jgi:ribosomal RNA-processing protein 9
MKKKMSAPNGGARKGKGFSRDPFFVEESKKRRKIESDVIRSDSDEEYGLVSKYGIEEEEAELVEETADEKRQRVARAHLDKVRGIAAKVEEDEEEREGEREDEREGERDSRVSMLLQQEQLEDAGRVRRAIASRYSLF